MKQALHLKAPGNWLNDPNGFIYYKGQYHLFYQHFPFAPVWGTMHWGHAVSDDLVHWEHQDVAVFPTKDYDKDGVFSGGAFELDGDMLLYYTGVKYHGCEPDNCHVPLNDVYECRQAMIRSADGYHFDNYKDKQMILPMIDDDSIANFNHTRDPKVWKQGDTYYMVLGSTYRKEVGRLIVCKSEDAVHWDIVTSMTDPRFGRILECPDLFRLPDADADGKPLDVDTEGKPLDAGAEENMQDVLLISPMYILPKSEGYEAHSMVGKVSFDPDTCQVSDLGDFQYCDYGRDLYATQTCLDEEGRRVFISWMRMPNAVKHSWDEKAWNGMMCLPRLVECHADGIHFPMHPNARAYFDRKISTEELTECREKRNISMPNRPECRETVKAPILMETTLKNGEELDIFGYRISMNHNVLSTDRSRVFPRETGLRDTFELPPYKPECKLTIVVEPNLIEIFVDDGRYVLSNTVYELGRNISGKIEEVWVSSEDFN